MATLSVHTGRWTDWSKGSILGDQYTMSVASGNILIAFIAIFITLVGGVVWSIVAYGVHQLRVSYRAMTGLHYQSQALLRNIHSPLIFAQKIIETGLAWRKRTSKRTITATFGLALFAIAIYGAFATAGLLLTYIATTGDVLLRSATCGELNTTALNNESAEMQNAVYLALNAQASELIVQAYDYATVCYPGTDLDGSQEDITAAPASDCSFYVKRFINWTTSYPGICPFNEGMCKSSSADIVRFDTGLLDTHSDLGRNSPKVERVQFRRVTTCAPIVTDGFSSNGFINDSILGNVAIWNYGTNLAQPALTPQSAENANETFVYSHSSYQSGDLPYLLLSASSIDRVVLGNTSYAQALSPDPRLTPSEAAVTLFFLANRALYQAPVEDLWFNATTLIPANNTLSGGVDWYYSEAFASILGCRDEVEICNPVNNKCANWTDWASVGVGDTSNKDDFNALQFNAKQKIVSEWVARYLYISSMWSIVASMGGNALSASEYLLGRGSLVSSLSLPTNQWIVELERLQAASLAYMQRAAFTDALGYTDPTLISLLVYRDFDDWTCKTQKFRDTTYTSFSVLGLGLIFGFGIFILLLGAVISFVLPAIQRRSGKGEYRRLQWYTSGVLRLQRIVFEDRGLGHWKGSFEDDNDKVPVTDRDELVLPFTGEAVAVFMPSDSAVVLGRDGANKHTKHEQHQKPASQSNLHSTLLEEH